MAVAALVRLVSLVPMVTGERVLGRVEGEQVFRLELPLVHHVPPHSKVAITILLVLAPLLPHVIPPPGVVSVQNYVELVRNKV